VAKFFAFGFDFYIFTAKEVFILLCRVILSAPACGGMSKSSCQTRASDSGYFNHLSHYYSVARGLLTAGILLFLHSLFSFFAQILT